MAFDPSCVPSNASSLPCPSSWENTISAPAKVNLFFQTFPKEPRSPGLHEIRSLIAPCTLTDTIQVKVSWLQGDRFSVRIRLTDPTTDLPLGPENLLWQAASAWWEAWRKKLPSQTDPVIAPQIDLTLTKKIPWAAGLGGGSSDAAALLRALQSQAAHPLPEEEMQGSICPSLGSDVYPAYLGQLLAVEGTGHRIASLYTFSPDVTPPSCLLLTFPNIHFSTPLFYRKFDALGESLGGHLGEHLGGHLVELEERKSPLSNSFAPLSLAAFPAQADLVQEIASFAKSVGLACRSGRDIWHYLDALTHDLPVQEKNLDESFSLPEIFLPRGFWQGLWNQGDLYCDLSGTGPTIFLLYPPRLAQAMARLAARLQEMAARRKVEMGVHWTKLIL